jgi:membrane-anchored protein YejM (alkaline phosphatase superfamily)
VATEPRARRQLLRWTGWFGTANVAVHLLIVSRYLWGYPFTTDVIGNIYVLVSLIAHSTFLAFGPLILFVIPLLLVLPSRRLVTVIAVTVMSFSISLLLLDSNVFAENRYHLTWLTLEIMEWSTWAFAGIFFVIVLVFESLLAGLVRSRLASGTQRIRGRWIGISLTFFLLVSHSIHIWGDAVGHTPVIQFTRFMPFHFPMKAKRAMLRLGLVDPEQVKQRLLLRRSGATGDGELRYPLKPMNCRAEKESLPNILIMLVDGLRADTIHPDLMPDLSEFQQHALRFTQHFSGGNSTRMGIFSLFYGVPTTYWQSFQALRRSPVLMDQVKDNGYQAGLFSSIGFGSPMLGDRTAFAWWPGLPIKGADLSMPDRNKKVSDDWLNWLSERDTRQPFFGYLHYSPPMRGLPAENQSGNADSLPMEDRFTGNPDVEEEWLRYRRALKTVNHEIGRILDSLKTQALLDDTIVIVTSDHGREFDDNGLGYMGHGTAFSNAQLLSPMIISWPGKEPAEIRYRTSHYDLPVTLLQDVFDCNNPPHEYSVGQNLFSGTSWTWMVAGSYNGHAIVEPDRVIVSHPGGFMDVRDRNYRPISRSNLNGAVVKEVMEAQSRFFK